MQENKNTSTYILHLLIIAITSDIFYRFAISFLPSSCCFILLLLFYIIPFFCVKNTDRNIKKYYFEFIKQQFIGKHVNTAYYYLQTLFVFCSSHYFPSDEKLCYGLCVDDQRVTRGMSFGNFNSHCKDFHSSFISFVNWVLICSFYGVSQIILEGE